MIWNRVIRDEGHSTDEIIETERTFDIIWLKEPRKNPGKQKEWVDPAIEEYEFLKEQGLVRTGRLFGGLVDDIKRKAPWSV